MLSPETPGRSCRPTAEHQRPRGRHEGAHSIRVLGSVRDGPCDRPGPLLGRPARRHGRARGAGLVEGDDATIKYNTWFVFDLDIDAGRTVADMFLAQRGWTIGPAERQFIERVRAATMRLYQIEAVERDKGIHLIDLWTKDRVFVHERPGHRDAAMDSIRRDRFSR